MKKDRAFTLLEMMASITVLLILTVLLFSGAQQVRLRTQTTQCLAGHRQIAQAILAYAADHSGQLPVYYDRPDGQTAVTWGQYIAPYLNTTQQVGYKTLRCPAAREGISTTVGVNYSEQKGKAPFGIGGDPKFPGSMRLAQVSRGTVLTADIENPSGHAWFLSPNQFPLTLDQDGDGVKETRPGNPPSNWFMFRHQGKSVCSLADGSARIVTPRQWGLNEDLLWGP